jgi:hypothetical protein
MVADACSRDLFIAVNKKKHEILFHPEHDLSPIYTYCISRSVGPTSSVLLLYPGLRLGKRNVTSEVEDHVVELLCVRSLKTPRFMECGGSGRSHKAILGY